MAAIFTGFAAHKSVLRPRSGEAGRKTVIVARCCPECGGHADISDLVGGYGAWAGAPPPQVAVGLPNERESPTMTAEVPEVTPEDVAALLTEGAVLLDVREVDEWQAGHTPMAAHVPMREVPGRIDEIPNDRRVVAICRSGGRSRAVAEALIGAGYDVVNVYGGMRAWEAADLPIETDDGSPGVVA